MTPTRTLLSVVAVVALGTTGCGNGGSDTVSTGEWADRVCEATADASAELTEVTTGDRANDLAGGGEGAQGRFLLDLAGAQLGVSRRYVSALVAAGAPDLEGGEQWYQGVRDIADEVERRGQVLQDRLASIDAETVIPGDLQAILPEITQLGQEISALREELAPEANQEFQDALESSRACQAAGGPPTAP